MSGEIHIDLTCEHCQKNRKQQISPERRLLAQVFWPTPEAKAIVRVAVKLNQAGVEQGWAMPGQSPGTRAPLVAAQREAVKLVPVGDEGLKEIHCRGCGAGFKYSRAQFAGMAGRSKKKARKTRGFAEQGIPHNLGRPRGDL